MHWNRELVHWGSKETSSTTSTGSSHSRHSSRCSCLCGCRRCCCCCSRCSCGCGCSCGCVFFILFFSCPTGASAGAVCDVVRPVAVSVPLARLLWLVLRAQLVVRLDGLLGGAVLPGVLCRGHADMGEDVGDGPDRLRTPLAEHHPHVLLQVLGVLDEPEAHGRLVARTQVFLRHADDGRGLTNAADMNCNRTKNCFINWRLFNQKNSP